MSEEDSDALCRRFVGRAADVLAAAARIEYVRVAAYSIQANLGEDTERQLESVEQRLRYFQAEVEGETKFDVGAVGQFLSKISQIADDSLFLLRRHPGFQHLVRDNESASEWSQVKRKFQDLRKELNRDVVRVFKETYERLATSQVDGTGTPENTTKTPDGSENTAEPCRQAAGKAAEIAGALEKLLRETVAPLLVDGRNRLKDVVTAQ